MANARACPRGKKFPGSFDIGHGALPMAVFCCA